MAGRDVETFVIAATDFLTELNHIHPFREGNGRVQLVFTVVLSERAGHRLDLESLDPDTMLAAMIASYHDDKRLLRALLGRMAGI